MASRTASGIILLDACAVINFVACGRLGEIARYFGNFRIADLVAGETMYIRRGGSDEEAAERQEVELQPFIDSHLLEVESASNEDELNTFIDLTLDLEDGEAMTLAIAIHRDFAVVTDDRKAIRIAAGRVEVRSTLETLKHWTDHNALPDSEIQKLLVDLRDRGRYIPGRSHPLYSWWAQIMTSS